MTGFREVYKCNVCGNIVEVLHASVGELVCCGKPMEHKTENTQDASTEKHVPVLTRIKGGVEVEVGLVAHPMEEAHHIEWIEIASDGGVQRKYLRPGNKPQATFECAGAVKDVREYCNLHGLWKKK
jgi:superoxide reductase